MFWRIGLAVLIGGVGVSCSQSWREGTPDHTPEEVAQFLSEIGGAQGQSLAFGDLSSALQHQDDSRLFFADAPSKTFADPLYLLGFADLIWLAGDTAANIGDLAGARVLMLEHLADSGALDIGLVVGLDSGSGYSYYGFSGTGEINSNRRFEARLNGANGDLILRSWDSDGSELNDIIQLEVWRTDTDGVDVKIGKFTTLFAY